MRCLSESQLQLLYNNFCDYRDRVCGGRAEMGIQAFYEKYGLERHE